MINRVILICLLVFTSILTTCSQDEVKYDSRALNVFFNNFDSILLTKESKEEKDSNIFVRNVNLDTSRYIKKVQFMTDTTKNWHTIIYDFNKNYSDSNVEFIDMEENKDFELDDLQVFIFQPFYHESKTYVLFFVKRYKRLYVADILMVFDESKDLEIIILSQGIY